MSKVKIKKFKNGAVLIYRKRNGSNHTAVNIGFNAGSKDNDKNGVAHFLEHMLFNGTNNLTKQEIDEKNEKLCFVNAFTSNHCIMVNFKKSNKVIDKAFEFASDILINTKFDETYLDKEKGVIIEEYRMRNEKCKHDVRYQHGILASTKHYTFVKSLGTPEDINTITIQDLQEYKDKYFVAQNFIASIVGKISFGKAKKLVKKHIFPNLKSNPEFNTIERTFDYDKPEGYQVYKNDEDKVNMVLSFKFYEPQEEAKKNYNYAVICHFLKRNKDSMFVRLREKGLVYSASPEVSSADNTGLFSIYTSSSKDKIKEILSTISETLKDIKNGAIKQEELDACIQNLKYSRDEGNPISYRQASENYIFDYSYYHKIEIIKDKQRDKWMKNATIDTVKETANKIFDKKTPLYVTFMGNIEKTDVPTLKEIKKILDL